MQLPGCPNFDLTVTKFVFSNSGNFRAKANPPLMP